MMRTIQVVKIVQTIFCGIIDELII